MVYYVPCFCCCCCLVESSLLKEKEKTHQETLLNERERERGLWSVNEVVKTLSLFVWLNSSKAYHRFQGLSQSGTLCTTANWGKWQHILVGMDFFLFYIFLVPYQKPCYCYCKRKWWLFMRISLPTIFNPSLQVMIISY